MLEVTWLSGTDAKPDPSERDEKALEECQQSLDDYAARVYAEEEDGH